VLAAIALVVSAICCSHETRAATNGETTTLEPGVYDVEHPELFPLVTIGERALSSELIVNGTVYPEAARTIHVTSLGSGRVIDLKAHLGDQVERGQPLIVISSSDLGGANGDYQKARADEELSRKALTRAESLFAYGALAKKDLEAAQDAEEKSRVDVQTADQRVRLLGGDPAHPSSRIELRAPVSGTVVEQNVAGSEGIKSLDNSPNLLTIADLSEVWVLCDVYENALSQVHVGDVAEITLNAFPDRLLHGVVSDIARVLDPTTRSAKVRIVLANPDGSLRPGMYAVSTIRSRERQPQLVIPGTAIMRLQDKDWVFRREAPSRFRRIEVRTAGMTPDGMQRVRGGVKGGDMVVVNALAFSSAVVEQKR
jgi:membrane fusion protein, heavy metal efflux system